MTTQTVVIERAPGCRCYIGADFLMSFVVVKETEDSSGAFAEWYPCPHGSVVRAATAADHAQALGLTVTDFTDAEKDSHFEQPKEHFRRAAAALGAYGEGNAADAMIAIREGTRLIPGEAARRVREAEKGAAE